MKKQLLVAVGTVILASSPAMAASGEALFKQHCEICHPDGGNIIEPTHTLHKKNLEQHGIKDWKGIVKNMRTPAGPGMTAFDAKTISEQDAKAIAEYVLKTFK